MLYGPLPSIISKADLLLKWMNKIPLRSRGDELLRPKPKGNFEIKVKSTIAPHAQQNWHESEQVGIFMFLIHSAVK